MRGWLWQSIISGLDFIKAWEGTVYNNSASLLLFSCSDSFKEQYSSTFIYLPLRDVHLFLGSVSNRLESSAFIYPQLCLWGGSEIFIGLDQHSVGTYTQLIQVNDKKVN